MRLAVDQDRCIGSGSCAFTSPEVFSQSTDDGLVLLLEAVPDRSLQASVETAIRSCPVSAISRSPS